MRQYHRWVLPTSVAYDIITRMIRDIISHFAFFVSFVWMEKEAKYGPSFTLIDIKVDVLLNSSPIF